LPAQPPLPHHQATDPAAAAALIRRAAAARGFNRVAFTAATGAPGIDDYDRFLAEGRHAEMAWMERSRAPRADPRQLLADARSAVVLGVDYAWPRPPDPGGLTGKVASYAWGRDYHNLIGKRLRHLGQDLRDLLPGLQTYSGVDSRPLIERAWAGQSGIGYLGKNCLLIVPGQTSYLFLAVMLVDIDLPSDVPRGDHCGRCRRCLDACPTDAFTDVGQLDARRCISYLTIEHKSPIPEALRPGLGRWVFGCDVCQEVCPHNPNDPHSSEPDLAPRPGNAWLDLPELLNSDDDTLLRRFEGSPIRRAGAVGLKRNAALVLGNIGDPAARPALDVAARHPSPVVRDAAEWARARC
jgi:epoxyqueuosine reductase